jgi:hypothetical protein
LRNLLFSSYRKGLATWLRISESISHIVLLTDSISVFFLANSASFLDSYKSLAFLISSFLNDKQFAFAPYNLLKSHVPGFSHSYIADVVQAHTILLNQKAVRAMNHAKT